MVGMIGKSYGLVSGDSGSSGQFSRDKITVAECCVRVQINQTAAPDFLLLWAKEAIRIVG